MSTNTYAAASVTTAATTVTTAATGAGRPAAVM